MRGGEERGESGRRRGAGVGWGGIGEKGRKKKRSAPKKKTGKTSRFIL